MLFLVGEYFLWYMVKIHHNDIVTVDEVLWMGDVRKVGVGY